MLELKNISFTRDNKKILDDVNLKLDSNKFIAITGPNGYGVDVENDFVGQSPEFSSFGYTNLGLAVVDGNLNIRKEASVEASIVGKMTNYAACEILGEANGFYQIKSGNAEGYVSKDYIITGEEALIIAQTEARNMAKVTTNSLRVRSEATTESQVLSSVNKDEEIVVLEELKGLKIGVQSGSIQAQDLEKSEFGKNVTIIEYQENLTAFMDLEVGGIDALFCSNIIGNYLITTKGKDYKTVPSENITISKGSVIAFKQGNVELRDKIQNALAEVTAEGKAEEISKKWFGLNMAKEINKR